MKTEIKRKDEEKFLKFKIADNACFENPLTFDEIIEYISMGILPLEVSEDDGTKVLDEEQFEEIKRVVPFLLKIIDKLKLIIYQMIILLEQELLIHIHFLCITMLGLL